MTFGLFLLLVIFGFALAKSPTFRKIVGVILSDFWEFIKKEAKPIVSTIKEYIEKAKDR